MAFQLQKINVGDSILERFEVLEELGVGGFSQVFSTMDLKTGQTVALKISGEGTMPIEESDDEFTNVESAMKEIRIMKKIASCTGKGKDLCGLMTDWFFLENRLAIVFPRYSTSVYDLMNRLDRLPFIWENVVTISYQLVHAIKFLHDNRITHMDIKPHNLMLLCADYQIFCLHDSFHDSEGSYPQQFISLRNPEIKLIDFGSCLSAADNRKTFFVGISGQYSAPEFVLGTTISNKYDIWSIGCTIVEIYMGFPLFPECDDKSDYWAFLKKTMGEVPESMNVKVKQPSTRNIIDALNKRCTLAQCIAFGNKDRVYLYQLLSNSILKIDPHERASCNQILSHTFFKHTTSLVQKTMDSWSISNEEI